MTYLIKPQIKCYTKNLWWNRSPRAIKNRYESLNTETLRCKRNNISNVLKDVFYYNSFLLDFQLMKVTEYLLMQQTYWSNFYLKKSKHFAVTRPKKLKTVRITSFISE